MHLSRLGLITQIRIFPIQAQLHSIYPILSVLSTSPEFVSISRSVSSHSLCTRKILYIIRSALCIELFQKGEVMVSIRHFTYW